MPWTNVKDQPRKDGQTGQYNVDISILQDTYLSSSPSPEK